MCEIAIVDWCRRRMLNSETAALVSQEWRRTPSAG
jgi:hypothetical protein